MEIIQKVVQTEVSTQNSGASYPALFLSGAFTMTVLQPWSRHPSGAICEPSRRQWGYTVFGLSPDAGQGLFSHSSAHRNREKKAHYMASDLTLQLTLRNYPLSSFGVAYIAHPPLTIWRGCWNTFSFSNYEMCGAGFFFLYFNQSNIWKHIGRRAIWESSRPSGRQKLKTGLANIKKHPITFACFSWNKTNRFVGSY